MRLVLLFAVACTTDVVGDTATDADADTDTDTDTDTDCGLVFSAGARDVSGPCTECAADSLSVWGVVANTCSEDAIFSTTSSCLVASWTLADDTGTEVSESSVCDTVLTDHVVPGGDELDEGWTPSGIPPIPWTVTVVFGDDAATSAQTAIEVK
jgi:hypothetical protein